MSDSPFTNMGLRGPDDPIVHAYRAHCDRWWATYNAALTGLCAKRSLRDDPLHHEISMDARIMADIAHGPLEPKS